MMHFLTAGQIARVLQVTDSLSLDRFWVTVPAPAAEVGSETVMGDGQVLICAPFGARFALWFQGLRERLARLDLTRVRKTAGAGPARRRVLDGPPIVEMTGSLGQAKDGDASAGGRRRGDPGMRPLTLDEVINGGVPHRAEALPAPDVAAVQDVGGEG